jgi:Thermophilic metalloprotease (M29).
LKANIQLDNLKVEEVMYWDIVKTALNFKQGDKLAIISNSIGASILIGEARTYKVDSIVINSTLESVKPLFQLGYKIIFGCDLKFSKDAYLYLEKNTLPWMRLDFNCDRESIEASVHFSKLYSRLIKKYQAMKIRQIKIKGPETDLQFEIPYTAKWMTSKSMTENGEVFFKNLPSFEIHIAPHAKKTIGYSKHMRFVRGRDVQTGEYVGEIGIVINPIKRSKDSSSLIIENTGHHIGLGHAMQKGVYYNYSSIHKDILIDDEVTITGICADGREVRIA